MVPVSIGENFITVQYTVDNTGLTITSVHAVKSIAIRCTDMVPMQLRMASGDTTGWPILAGETFTANITKSRRESGGGSTPTWNICHLQLVSGSNPNVFVMFTW